MAMESSGDERRVASKRGIKRPDPAEIVAFFSRKRKKDNDLRLARAQASFEEVANLLSQAFEAAKNTSVEAAEWVSARMESVLSGIQAEMDEDGEGCGSESPDGINQDRSSQLASADAVNEISTEPAIPSCDDGDAEKDIGVQVKPSVADEEKPYVSPTDYVEGGGVPGTGTLDGNAAPGAASGGSPGSVMGTIPDQGDVIAEAEDGAEAEDEDEAEDDDPRSPEDRGERMTKCRGKVVHGSLVPCQDPSSPHSTVMESTYVNGLLVVGRHRIRTAPGKWHYCGLRIPVDEGVKFIDRGSPTCRAILYR